MQNKNKNSRFQRGSGCFTCNDCGKQTRSTGRGDNENVGLCVTCYDRAGDFNSYQDGLITREEFNKRWPEHLIDIFGKLIAAKEEGQQ